MKNNYYLKHFDCLILILYLSKLLKTRKLCKVIYRYCAVPKSKFIISVVVGCQLPYYVAKTKHKYYVNSTENYESVFTLKIIRENYSLLLQFTSNLTASY